MKIYKAFFLTKGLYLGNKHTHVLLNSSLQQDAHVISPSATDRNTSRSGNPSATATITNLSPETIAQNSNVIHRIHIDVAIQRMLHHHKIFESTKIIGKLHKKQRSLKKKKKQNKKSFPNVHAPLSSQSLLMRFFHTPSRLPTRKKNPSAARCTCSRYWIA